MKLLGIRALRGTGAGLNLVEFCGTGKNSENFSIVKACAGRERDQIMGLRGGSEIKIWSRAGLYFKPGFWFQNRFCICQNWPSGRWLL